MKERARVYISGPMTGLTDCNREAFTRAEVLLKQLGHEVVNPHDIGDKLGEVSYEEYLKADLVEMLTKCNTIYMLTGYEWSKGATTELQVARACGFKVMKEEL